MFFSAFLNYFHRSDKKPSPAQELKILLEKRWNELPASVKTEQQICGVGGISCGATHSVMEKCNFACTSCYLSEAANYAKPLPFAEVKQQLDALRAYLGDGGKTQITSGEVTLLSPEELGRIVAYAKKIGLDPMVMTNGQRFLDVPGYLTALVDEHGLEKVCFHVDTTQKGRRGMQMGLRERDIHHIRDQFAELVREVRRRTGKPLYAAHTVTVTPDNLEGVTDITSWLFDNVDSIRLLSFLPVAEVGRTQDHGNGELSLDAVWARICKAAGKKLNRHALHFGHTQCNITVPVIVLRHAGRNDIIEGVREGRAWDKRVFAWLLKELGGAYDLNRGLFSNVPYLLALAVRRPVRVLELPFYALYRLLGVWKLILSVLLNLLMFRGFRVRALFLVVHKFMDPQELASDLGKERLLACVFKLPVQGKMVSMCELNASSMRLELNLARVDSLERFQAVAGAGRQEVQ